MLRSTLSTSMTAQGVPYSRAILAASGVVIRFDSSYAVALRGTLRSVHLRVTAGGSVILRCERLRASKDGAGVLRLFYLFAQHFQLQPAVFGGGELLLGCRDRGGSLLKLLAIFGVKI